MSKPIEPGCLALITYSHAGNTGKVVRVIKYLGEVEGFWSTPDRWEIDTWINTSDGMGCNHHPEQWLMRIDGEDFSHETEEEKILEKENA